jgi:dolichyl-phosphate-mannose--protein O-mannosyl transferase
LHSHEINYPKGSGQQQVTIYRYRDENNVWMIEPAGGDLVEELTGTAENTTWSLSEPKQDGFDSYEEGDSFAQLEKIGEKLNVSGRSMLDSLINSLTSMLQMPLSLPANPTSELPKTGKYKSETHKKYFGIPVREPIRLRHFITQRRLHSHKVEPPISVDEYQNEVSTYGGVGNIGDDNDVWIVEVYNDEWANKTQPWMSMRTTVRFQHAELGCYLFGHSVNLPEWGLGQLEVTCSFQGKIENSFWYVESNFHPLVASGDIEDEFISYPPIPLFDKFSEYVHAMKGVSDAIVSSQFWTWPGRILPVLPDAVPLYKKHHRQVLLFGNYIVWRLSLISLLAYSAIAVSRRFLGQRNILVFQQWPAYERSATTLLVAWATHYIPLLGSASLDISDYLPALWPSILVFVIIWEYIVQTLLNRPVWHATSCVIIIICVAYVYFVYSPLIYASPWTPKDCSAQEGKWFFDCGEYLNTTEYRLYDPDNFVHYADFARKIRNLTTSGSSKCYGPHPSQVAD